MSNMFSSYFSYFGSGLGMIFVLVILITATGRTPVKVSLASLILITSLMILLGTLNYTGEIIHYIYLVRVDSPIHFLFGPAAFFYVYTSLDSSFTFKKIHLVHLLPFLLNFIWFLPLFLSSTTDKTAYYNGTHSDGTVVLPLQYLLKTTSTLVYFILQLFLAKRYNLFAAFSEKANRYVFYWFVFYFFCQLLLTTGLFIDHITGLSLFPDPYRFAINMLTAFLSLLLIGLLFSPRLLHGTIETKKIVPPKYSHSRVNKNEALSKLSELELFMNTTPQPYLRSKLTLAEVATHCSTSPQILSQIINEYTGLNFNDYVNTFRIKEAKRLLSDSAFSYLTVDAIAQQSGFSSKSTFYASFKKQVGLLPKEFIANSAENTVLQVKNNVILTNQNFDNGLIQ